MNKFNDNNKDNIIPFPNLEERLLNKGIEALSNRQFKDALQVFKQLSRNFPNYYPEGEIGIVVCLYELGIYEDAKERCMRLLQEGIGDYFNVLKIYLSILMQQGEFSEIVTILEPLFNEERIPAELAEELFQLLEFSKKSISQKSQLDRPMIDTGVLEEQLLHGTIEEQLLVIQKLRSLPINSKIIDCIELVLINEKSHPIIQSMLLHLLMEKQINESFTVKKFQQTISLNTKDLKSFFEETFTIEVLNKLDYILGQENPTLYEHVKELWNRFLFTLFPFQPDPARAMVWAAALHKVGYELFGIEINDIELNRLYNENIDDIKNGYEQLVAAEKLSITGLEL
ncbi:outer membrane protein assembly factor BamD [Calidifontibacillus oryziterrae]|uniref:hypothetical protein n=1 Tax=Calidifontibacillus oryziterrae TaxID=1191699 RepID=UPI00030F235D|nr:hypothetical protein [Calidifontibacillus oryziterrae]